MCSRSGWATEGVLEEGEGANWRVYTGWERGGGPWETLGESGALKVYGLFLVALDEQILGLKMLLCMTVLIWKCSVGYGLSL